MSDLSINYWQPEEEFQGLRPGDIVQPLPRSLAQPLLLIIPVLVAATSYFMGGIPVETDLAFVALTILCISFLLAELYHFSERFGIGGLTLYGGVLIWFCYDYFVHWFGVSMNHWEMAIGKDTVAKSAMYHMIFIVFMSLGLRIRRGLWVPRLFRRLPNPSDPRVFFWVVLATQLIGLLPFSIFTSEPFFMAIWHQISSGRAGGAAWMYGRSGNANYNWGAYIAQLLQVGSVGSIFAAFYAVFLSRNKFESIVCWLIWALWLSLDFGTGTRGEVVFMVVPVAGFLFIKMHAKAADLMHRFSLRAYILLTVLLVAALLLVQIQIRFRNEGFNDMSLSSVDFVDVQGNTMFSEGLRGFSLIPERHDFFYNKLPLEAIVLPVPNFIFWMSIHPFPRALWWSKPLDPASPWYNDVAMGGSGENGGRVEGTTTSEGLVGYWFFRFGLAGVLEGGLLVGWIMATAERVLLNAGGHSLMILASLAMATWIFRCYRDISFAEFYESAIGIVVMAMLVIMLRPFAGDGAPSPEYAQ